MANSNLIINLQTDFVVFEAPPTGETLTLRCDLDSHKVEAVTTGEYHTGLPNCVYLRYADVF